VRKLTRRLGAETVAELTRTVIRKAVRERRFRPRVARIDSTVVEADVRYPSDAALCLPGARALARSGQRLARRIGAKTTAVTDRSRAIGRRVRRISRTLARRTGKAREQVIAERRGAPAPAPLGSPGEASRRPGAGEGARARRPSEAQGGRGAGDAGRALGANRRADREAAPGREDRRSDRLARRPRGAADPHGQGGQAERVRLRGSALRADRQHEAGARGFVLPPASAPGNPGENTLLPDTVSELRALELRPKEVALDGGFGHHRSEEQLAEIEPDRVFVSGRSEPGSQRTKRRLRRYRTGSEGRISHLKRGYGLRRSRLKGSEGQRIWSGWSVLAYDLDTFAVLTG
jgi:IS5 family transposase